MKGCPHSKKIRAGGPVLKTVGNPGAEVLHLIMARGILQREQYGGEETDNDWGIV
jgi:hypothetical protein